MGSTIRWLSVPVILLAALLGRVPTPDAAAESGRPPYNVILLSPDQLRADFLHSYGFPYPDSPNIDKFASEGTVFRQAYSAGGWTTPSVSSILTGLFPTVHGMTLPPYESCGVSIAKPLTDGTLPPVPPDLTLSSYKPILPELLRSAGMVTAADNANCWSIWDIASRGWDTLKFFPGFQLPVPGHPHVSAFYLTAPQTTEWAENWLKEQKDSRFFLWVHYMEPHTPYNAPQEYDLFKTPEDYPGLTVSDSGKTPGLYPMAKAGDAHAIHRLEQLYAAKILYMDHYVGHFLDTIRSLGLKQNTIVILMSDHGQLVYSHPEDFNTDDHLSVYEADRRVPLIFWGPGIAAGRRLDALAGQYDLLPTILSLEALPLPKPVDGKSLVPVLTGKEEKVSDYAYGEETAYASQYSIRGERYKLIETMRTGATQCFDLQADPNEQTSICSQIPQMAAELKAALDAHIDQMVREAHSYPDWQQNQALAVLEQRDTSQLEKLAPRTIEITGNWDADFQVTGRSLWRLSPHGVFWAPPGDGSAWARWRWHTPLIGDYEIALRWDRAAGGGQRLAIKANFIVEFKGGTRAIVVNLDSPPSGNDWLVLGQFHDPVSVTVSNMADGPIVAGSVRFQRLQQ